MNYYRNVMVLALHIFCHFVFDENARAPMALTLRNFYLTKTTYI